jgi:hypothetical protein
MTLLLIHIFMFCQSLKLYYIALLPVRVWRRSCRHDPASRRQESANNTEQALILVRLDEIFRSAYLEGFAPMLLASP